MKGNWTSGAERRSICELHGNKEKHHPNAVKRWSESEIFKSPSWKKTQACMCVCVCVCVFVWEKKQHVWECASMSTLTEINIFSTLSSEPTGQCTHRCSAQHLKRSQGHMWKHDVYFICAQPWNRRQEPSGLLQLCAKIVLVFSHNLHISLLSLRLCRRAEKRRLLVFPVYSGDEMATASPVGNPTSMILLCVGY